MNLLFRSAAAVCTLLFSLTCLTAAAEDFNGSWNGMYLDHTLDHTGEMTVVITQEDNSVAGTFTTSSGSAGSFKGQADGDRFVGYVTDFVDNKKAQIRFAATLHRGMLIWEGIGVAGSDIRSVSGALTTNWIQNTGHWVNLRRRNYPSLVQEGELGAGISEPGVSSVVLLTPELDETLVSHWDEDRSRYEIDRVFDIANMDIVYPNGIYPFVIEYTDGSTGACFSALTGDMPEQNPQILTPLTDALVDETQAMEITWNPWLSPGSNTHISIYFDETGLYTDLENTAVQYDLPAGSLSDSMMEWLKVGFSCPGYFSNKKVTAKSYFRTALHKINEHWFVKIKTRLPLGQIGGGIYLGMDAAGVDSAVLIPPPGATGDPMALSQHAKMNGLWETSGNRCADFEDLELSYPDGDYTLSLVYKDGSSEVIPLTMGGDYPAAIPNITQPADGSREWWKSFSAQWDDLSAAYDDSTFIYASLDEIDSMSENSYLTSATEAWGDDEFPLADGMQVPAGVMRPNKSYAYSVMLAHGTGTENVFKAASDIVFIETPTAPVILTVSKSGSGAGVIAGNDAAVSCPAAEAVCTAQYNYHPQIVLLAIPEIGSVFSKWEGDPDCLDGVVDMTTSKTCTAVFNKSFVGAPVDLLLLE